MKLPSLLMLAASFAIIGSLDAQTTQTNIRPDPTGKRLLFVDGDNIRPDPGGKRLLFIDGDNLRPEPGGKRLLFIDQDGDVRPQPGGVRLAHWEQGGVLRKSPGGPRLGLVDDHDFRPEPGYKRYFYMDGTPLNRMQLTAVLYLLKPEFFQISPTEKAEKEKEMAKNGAEEDAKRGADQFPGDHPILSHSTTSGAERTGSIQVTKQGEFYALTLKTGDSLAWQGIGVKVVTGGEQELWAGIAPSGAVSVGVYNIKGGALSGIWIPINAAEDKSVLGYENLGGAAKIGGVYKISSGKLPNGGVTYSGAMNIDPLTESLLADAPCYRFRWTTGTTGLAFRVGDRLFVAAGWGADYEVLRLRLDHADGLGGDFLGKSGAKGSYNLAK